MALSTAGRFAVVWLRNFIDDNKIKNQASVNLNRLWEMMDHADDSSLKHGWIVNFSSKPVHFYVYRSNDSWKWLNSHDVHVQPGETVEVHAGMFEGCFPEDQVHMVVYKDNKGAAYNVKKGTLHFWTGSCLIGQGLSIQKFKNLCYNPPTETEGQNLMYGKETIVKFFTVALDSYRRLMDKFY